MGSQNKKRPLELCSSSERPPKIQGTPRSDDSPGDVEEFFALVERIEAMQKSFRHKRPFNRTTHEICGMRNIDERVLVMNSKSPWQPTFEWEDFCYSPKHEAKGTQYIASNSTSVTMNDNAKVDKEGISSVNHLAVSSSQHMNLPSLSGLDLNVESSTPEHSVPCGLPFLS
eukprot:Gb_24132 [translate_table: standard]